ncbi:hypothetical protein PCIT_a4267 [Pseudoalteromonas citrea]|uniref:Uncharacterized protein n=2 Tax=Pseudoalteromonas citrea TaxID=43655 RepID=A0AAD4AIF1_9GAMM|nr:hypothetical protein [Pseudoalteromonas citrea]KAF7771209.1 hypothetical protein PCIT_a4267 [Pseudoalteromonas citrea]
MKTNLAPYTKYAVINMALIFAWVLSLATSGITVSKSDPNCGFITEAQTMDICYKLHGKTRN